MRADRRLKLCGLHAYGAVGGSESSHAPSSMKSSRLDMPRSPAKVQGLAYLNALNAVQEDREAAFSKVVRRWGARIMSNRDRNLVVLRNF